MTSQSGTTKVAPGVFIPPRPLRIVFFVVVAALLYGAMLFPWHAAMPGYAKVVGPLAGVLVRVADAETRLKPEGAYVRVARVFPSLRVAARDEYRDNPVVFSWLNHMMGGDLHRAMYPANNTRAKAEVRLVDLFRLTLDLPLYLALLAAFFIVVRRIRLRALLIGVPILVALHISMTACMGFWMAQRTFEERAGQIFDSSSLFWMSMADRYQIIGPAVALALFIILMLVGSFALNGEQEQAP